MKRFKSQRASDYENLQREIKYLRMLFDFIYTLNNIHEYKKLLEFILEKFFSLVKGERGFLMLYGESGQLELKVSKNIKGEDLKTDDFYFSREIINEVLFSGRPFLMGDISKKKGLVSSGQNRAIPKMVVCFPISTQNRIRGVIYVDGYSVRNFTEIEEKMLRGFITQAGVAVENYHLYEANLHDPLTGLYNYSYLRLRLNEEISRALRYKKECLSFVIFDLDNFKTINDSYGYQFANTILMKIGEIIKKTIRTSDIPARFGGDSFAILMPETNLLGAKSLAQRLQTEIAGRKFEIGNKVVAVTASFGVSIFPAERLKCAEDILIEADNVLNMARRKGGNNIVCFGGEEEEKEEFEIIGRSKAMQEIKRLVSRIAKTDTTVLILGETGTGKELVAQFIHKKSLRCDKPLVVINCGAIPETLLESELFGYEKGAFTGAYAKHIGKFESAQGGTLFLDEVGDLPLSLQVKILRAIEQKEVDRLGSKFPIKVDVRVIASSNKNLIEAVKNGAFREDLYYRLSVATIYIPPLRERIEDIEPLSRYYLNILNKKYHRAFRGFTKGAMEVMHHYQWPGNVRELIHRIERAVVMSTNQYITPDDLGLEDATPRKAMGLREARDEAERTTLLESLNRNRWNISKSARDLGISRKTLRDLIKKHNITKPTKDQ